MDLLANVCCLSSLFYADYPYTKYPEIALKQDRPYSCLIIESMEGLFICIPFRSHVKHRYAYHFQTSRRSKKTLSGLDYTKVALIKNRDYIDDTVRAVVDQDEHKEVFQNLQRIAREVCRYISDYKDDLNGVVKLHPKEWQRRYGMSTLPYFNDLLREWAYI